MRSSAAVATLVLLLGCRKEPLPAIDASPPDSSGSDATLRASSLEEDDDPPEPPESSPPRRGCEPACAADETCVGVTCVPSVGGVTMTTSHTCVLERTGRVRCWGANTNGEVGDGTRAVRARPVDVQGLDDAVQIAAFERSTCARRRGGDVVCWGHAPDRNADYLVPTPIGSLRGAIDIAYGNHFLCAVVADGEIRCLPDDRAPRRVGAPVNDAIAIAATRELCALRRDRTVTCFRHNPFAPDGGADEQQRVEGVTDIVRLATSGEAICAIAATGKAKCWSDAGIAVTEGSIRDVMVGGTHDFGRLGPVADLAFVGWPSDGDCAVKANGETVCWRRPYVSMRKADGQRPPRPLRLEPKVVPAPPAFRIVSTKHPLAHCILARTGEVHCWGDPAGARVGPSGNPDQPTAKAIEDVKGVREVVASDFRACARLTAGGTKCWGAGRTPQEVKSDGVERLLSGRCASIRGALTCFDQPFESSLPESGLRDIVEIAPAGSGTHILSYWARSSNGQIHRVDWSRSNDAEGKWTRTFVGPVEVSGASALIAAHDYTCVRDSATPSSLRCWERLSDAKAPLKMRTIAVPAGLGQVQLRMNGFNSYFEACGVSGGRVGCFDDKLQVKWLGLGDVRQYAMSPQGMSCALTGGGALHCWGDERALTGHGVAGVKEPRVVPGLERGVVGFAFARESWNIEDAVFVWMADGRLMAWGHNGRDDETMGQLGWTAPSVIKEPRKIER